MNEGVNPRSTHDRLVWPVDHPLAELDGVALGYVAAVVQLKGDWGEFGHTLGIADWSTWFNPCFLCKCTRATMLTKLRSISMVELPWPMRSDEDYDASATACEVHVRVETAEDLRHILRQARLEYKSNGKKVGEDALRADAQGSVWRFTTSRTIAESCGYTYAQPSHTADCITCLAAALRSSWPSFGSLKPQETAS